jgi:beta-lactamase regulating signal transducer with metallopeptidase domain
MVHWAAACLRTDQELACDAAVIARHPGLRRRYAETLLKTQLAPTALPLGCYWPAPARHPLEERIALLRRRAPRVQLHLAGASAVILVTLGSGAGSWLAKPVRFTAPAVERAVQAPKPPMLFMIYRDGLA